MTDKVFKIILLKKFRELQENADRKVNKIAKQFINKKRSLTEIKTIKNLNRNVRGKEYNH